MGKRSPRSAKKRGIAPFLDTSSGKYVAPPSSPASPSLRKPRTIAGGVSPAERVAQRTRLNSPPASSRPPSRCTEDEESLGTSATVETSRQKGSGDGKGGRHAFSRERLRHIPRGRRNPALQALGSYQSSEPLEATEAPGYFAQALGLSHTSKRRYARAGGRSKRTFVFIGAVALGITLLVGGLSTPVVSGHPVLVTSTAAKRFAASQQARTYAQYASRAIGEIGGAEGNLAALEQLDSVFQSLETVTQKGEGSGFAVRRYTAINEECASATHLIGDLEAGARSGGINPATTNSAVAQLQDAESVAQAAFAGR